MSSVRRKLSRVVLMYSPFSSSLSEYAIAWTTKSIFPQFSLIVLNTVSKLCSSLTSHCITSSELTDCASGDSRFRRASPWYVNASSAPWFAAILAIPHAIDRSLATPIISPRFPDITPNELLI